MKSDMTIYDVLKMIENRADPVNVNGKYVSKRNKNKYINLVNTYGNNNQEAMRLELVGVNSKYVLREDAKLYYSLVTFLNAPTVEEKEIKMADVVSILDEIRKNADYFKIVETVTIYKAMQNLLKALKTGNGMDKNNYITIGNNKSKVETPKIKIEKNIYTVLAELQTLNPDKQIIINPTNKNEIYISCEPNELKYPSDFNNNIYSIKKIITNKSFPNIKDSTNPDEILNAIKKLNPNVIIFFDPDTKSRIYCNVDPSTLIYPEGFYYNSKNGITNKHNTSGLYTEIYVKSLINDFNHSGNFSVKSDNIPNDIIPDKSSRKIEKETKKEVNNIIAKKYGVVKNTQYNWKDLITKKINAIKANFTAEKKQISPAYKELLNELDEIVTFTMNNGYGIGQFELDKFIMKVNNYREDILSIEEKNTLIAIVNKYKTSLEKNNLKK